MKRSRKATPDFFQLYPDSQSGKLTRILLMVFLVLSIVTTSGQSWPTGIHDPSSIVKEGDTYWIFGTGDGILCKSSKDMVAWKTEPSPFKDGFPSWILQYATTSTDQFEGFFWAPDIIQMNNKYYLYYSCSVWGTMNSCIGVVVNETLDPQSPDYEWVDQGDIGIWSNGGHINAIDPAVMRAPDGKIWLAYGSFNRDGIVVTEVDSTTGRPISTRTSIANSYTGNGWYGEGEGGCIIYRDNYYYLFYNKGGCCNGIASSYYMVVGRSENVRGPYYDKNDRPMRAIGVSSGGTTVFRHDDSRGLEDRYYGPGHFALYREDGVDYVTFHYYDPTGYYPSEEANYMGGPTLGLAKLSWGEDGWPSIDMDFLEEGIYMMENEHTGKMMDLKNQFPNEGTGLYQYSSSPLVATQKWFLTPLGTGEYTIRSYADPEKYLEVSATNNTFLRITSAYTGGVNQKFRIVKNAQGKLMIYPSTKNTLMEIPSAIMADYSIKLHTNTNHDCQRWNPIPFEETLSVSRLNIVFDFQPTKNESLVISSNGSWSLSVSDTSWINVSRLSGSGNDTIEISAALNESLIQRNGKITVNSNAGKSIEVFLYQTETTGRLNDAHDIRGAFSFYPNPSDGVIRLMGTLPITLEIYDIAGNMVKTIRCEENGPIDLHELDTGVYLVRGSNSTSTVVRKLIMQ